MISAEAYQIIYLLIVTFVTIIYLDQNKCNGYSPVPEKSKYKKISLGLAISFSIFIGLRPIDVTFVDMVTYAEQYKWLEISHNEFSWETDNVIFDNLILACSRNQIGIELFFLIIATIYFLGAYVGIRRIIPENVFIAYLVWLGSFSTFSYGVNGIKAGAAASIFILAISYYDKKIISIILAIISLGFHHSMQLPIAAYVIAIFIKKEKWYFRAWVICVVLAMLHITYFQTLFAGWTDGQGAYYLSSIDAEFVKHKGFRIDFVIYSALPVLLGYYTLFKVGFKDRLYSIILKTYLMSNSIWLLCMYAPFNNRIAYLSWFLYPILIIYPCIKAKKHNDILVRKRNLVVGLNLCFTLFMFFIYY